VAACKRQVAIRTAVMGFCVRACENQENVAVAAPIAAHVSFWMAANTLRKINLKNSKAQSFYI